METHPAVGDSASTTITTTTPASHEGKVESCAVVNNHQEDRTCESQSLSTSTTSTSIQEDHLNTPNIPLDIYENNNTNNNDESIVSFTNQQPLQSSFSSSSSRHRSSNDNINMNSSEHNSLSDQQQQTQEQEEQGGHNDLDISSQQQDQLQQQEQPQPLEYQHENDGIHGIQGREDNENTQEEGEELQEQTRIIEHHKLDEPSRSEESENDVLDDSNVSQDEHVSATGMISNEEPSDRPSLLEGVDGPTIQEDESRSCVSTNDDQDGPSGAAPLDQCIVQTDIASQDGNQDEERRAHVAEQSLPTQSTILQQHDNESDNNVPQIHVGQQEQSSDGGEEESGSPQDNNQEDVAANAVENEHDRVEGTSENTTEIESEERQSQLDVHVPSSSSEEEEARESEQTERAVSEVEPPSLHHIDEEQRANTESPPQLDDQSNSSRAFENTTSTDESALDEVHHHEQQNLVVPTVSGASIQQQQQQQHNNNIGIYEYQQHTSATNHNRDDASDHTVHSAPRSRRVWEADRQASECRRCNRRFNFLVRRHHCRRCGLVVCDRCSSHRIRLPPEDIVQDPAIDPSHYPLIAMHPQRVCDVCNRLPIKEIPASSSSPRRRATAPVSMSHMKRSPSSQSLMTECPVCGTDLLGMQKDGQEKHLQLCLNTGSPPVRPPRYLVYELSENSPQIDYECPICFEEFKAGEKIARMICLCSYHRHCLSDWLERGKGCPVHYDATISA